MRHSRLLLTLVFLFGFRAWSQNPPASSTPPSDPAEVEAPQSALPAPGEGPIPAPPEDEEGTGAVMPAKPLPKPKPKAPEATAVVGPQLGPQAPAQNGHPSASRTHFVEQSPVIDEVELIKGNPFIEVYIHGTGPIDCYDVREYVIEKEEAVHKTRIVPRFSRTDPDSACKKKSRPFREKAADLDPNSPATKDVEVLGYYGWHQRSL